VASIVDALDKSRSSKAQKPIALLLKTYKGYNFTEKISNLLNWHGKPLAAETDNVIKHLESLISGTEHKLVPTLPEAKQETPKHEPIKIADPALQKGGKIATRAAFGNALKKLGEACPLVIGADADVKNSTMTIHLKEAKPDQFIDCFVAEQNLIGVCLGAGVRGRIPFCATFAAFFTRAYDHIRMAAVS
jgi:transketolase